MGKHRILILGGTTEARQLAAALALRPDCDILLSLAGRTAEPMAQPVPSRSGGFGGSDGLAGFLAAENFDLLIDATHPFAARISNNAAIAAGSTGIAFFCAPPLRLEEATRRSLDLRPFHSGGSCGAWRGAKTRLSRHWQAGGLPFRKRAAAPISDPQRRSRPAAARRTRCALPSGDRPL
jgi:hypothetical protein